MESEKRKEDWRREKGNKPKKGRDKEEGRI
jgi:hypothetical protein